MSTYLEGLAEELRDYETTQKSRRLRVDPRAQVAVASKDLRTLALLRAEAQRVGALVAASASLANDAARTPGIRKSDEPLWFAPAFSAAVDSQMASLAEGETFFELHQLWLAMTAKLSFARDLAMARAAELQRSTGRELLKPDVVADAWCRACAALRDVVALIITLMEGQGVTLRPPHEAQGIALLEDAASGQSPCIESDGSFSLPGWAERRKERRRRLEQAIQIGIGIKTYPAKTENLSSGGMQIVAGFMIPTGSRVVVHFQDGRQVEATVRWSQGLKAGLAFSNPLGDRDPLWAKTGGDV